MALMNEQDDDLDTGGVSDGPSAVADTSGYISRSAQNPYTKDLNDLLKKYLQQTDRQATEKERLLDEARDRILKRSLGPSDSEVAFRIAAALGKPTRTGHFSEGLANVSEATAGILGERRKSQQELEDLDLKYRMAGLDTKSEGMKTKISALSTLARSVPKERVPEVETFALRASTPVPVVVTVKLVGGAVAPIVPVKVKLSDVVIVKACAPLIAPEIVC